MATPSPGAASKASARKAEPASTPDTTLGVDADIALVRALADILNDGELAEISYRKDALKIVIKTPAAAFAAPPALLAAPASPALAAAAPPATPSAASGAADIPDIANALTSPMVGTVYLRPSPDADAFVAVGASVAEGDTLMLVEAMKTFNPITADRSGIVQAIHVEDGQGIEFGDPLITLG